MKKCLLFVFLALLSISVSVSAAQVGDKIGEAVMSDITAYINNYPISSYVINDYAVIIAEDLRNYGCDVLYDESARVLSITKSATNNQFNVPVMYKTSMPTGTYFTDVLYTDIKTFVNGNEVTSFNVNGKTMIVIDQFGKYMDGYTYDDKNRAAQAWISEKTVAEYKPLTKRTEKIFEQEKDYSSRVRNYTGWHDVNFDGVNESVSVSVESEKHNYDGWWYDTLFMKVTMGDYTKRVDIDGNLDSIYLCDIDLTDGVKDLVVITVEGSDDPLLRIFRYGSNLPQYMFEGKYEDETYVYDSMGTGYVDFHYFNVNDDGTITIKEQISSYGMWHAYKTYMRNEKGNFEKIVPAYYEILPDLMEQRLEWNEQISGYERDMWKKGYIKAYCKYYGDGIVLNQGDYFKPLYDNGNNYIYVEKTNGQGGWIYVNWETAGLNHTFFMCAG